MARTKRGTRRRRTQRTRRMRKTMRGGSGKENVYELRTRNVPRAITKKEIKEELKDQGYGEQKESVYTAIMGILGSKKFIGAAAALAYVMSQHGATIILS